MKLLDLFCGAGGCSVGYTWAGFEVIGVDIDPHPDYPFEQINADALELMDRGSNIFATVDVIHASPPCPRYSTITPKTTRDSHPDLIGPVRDALKQWGGIYVIENVPGARKELDHPIRLCGSAFGLGVRRHRLFESNAPFLYGTDCLHQTQGRPVGVYGDHGDTNGEFLRPDGSRRGRKAADVDEAGQAMGIDWMTSWDDLADAIPPAYTEHIGLQLRDHIESLRR